MIPLSHPSHLTQPHLTQPHTQTGPPGVAVCANTRKNIDAAFRMTVAPANPTGLSTPTRTTSTDCGDFLREQKI